MGCARWGSFEEWSRLIPGAIVFAGGADPMLARPEGDEEVDDQLRNIRTIMIWFRRELGDNDFRISGVIEIFFKTKRILNPVNGGYAVDGYEDLRDAIEALVGKRGMKQEGRMIVPDPAELGKRLAAFKGRVIAGLKLITQTGGGGIMKWRVVPALTVVGTNISVVSSEHEPDIETDPGSGGPNISE